MINFEALDERLINLQPYRWVSIVRCKMTSDGTNEYQSDEFFSSLLSSPAYHNTYLSPGSWREDSVDTHGPFSIYKINPQHYRVISNQQFIQELLEVLNDTTFYTEKPTEQEIEEVMDVVNSFSEDLLYYKFERQHLPAKLHKNEYTFDFEHSFVLWEFVEFLIINQKENLLHILVLGLD